MQADRMRRMVAIEMARVFDSVDLVLVPSLRDEQLVIGNFTGHPSITLRTGFVEVSTARRAPGKSGRQGSEGSGLSPTGAREVQPPGF